MKRSEILDTAKSLTNGDREQDYGTPQQNFTVIAELWNAYLGENPVAKYIDAKDVAVMMTLVKIGRIASGHSKPDNWIDACGYMAIGGEIEADKPSEKSPYPATPITQEIYEELFAPVEPAKSKYDGLTDDELFTKLCVHSCDSCPIDDLKEEEKCCADYARKNTVEFRNIAIAHLGGLEGKA